jgi:hypothetical protein
MRKQLKNGRFEKNLKVSKAAGNLLYTTNIDANLLK